MTSASADSLSPEHYDAWYRTPRGRWIGEVEFRLLAAMLDVQPGERLLDVGCGTGYFTHRFALAAGARVTGVDPQGEWLAFARRGARSDETFVAGRAEALPFPDRSFDRTVSVAALCFVDDEQRALREMVRVTRHRLVVGLLNRRSLLYLQKGRDGGRGGYRGARWHAAREAVALFAAIGVREVEIRTAVLVPSAGPIARSIERLGSTGVRFGGLLVAAATIAR